ncbi:MAG: hypothetical protein MPW17_17385 [Candidatus Manganitrophus sp.]|nr:MAG: hypothetical protein MPW17_17385 [Candidatus Manganitrophus sp.]
MLRRALFASLAIFFVVVLSPHLLFAHGVIGKRFFPESLTVFDPFPSDEADLLAYSHFKDDEALVNSYGFGISKRFSPNLSFDLDGAYNQIHPNDGSQDLNGFENFALAVKYSMLRVPEHEFILTSALEWEMGGTGSKEIGREPHSSLTPQLLLGYGLGDLPEGMKYLKPLAIEAQVGLTTPGVGNETTEAAEIATTLSYGFVVEYSILYLQSFVKDVGIGGPFSRMVPIVEFSFEQPINGPDGGDDRDRQSGADLGG